MKSVFLDTNIVLDLLDSKRSLHEEAKKLIEKLMREGVEIYISEDMLSTIYYVAKEKEKVLAFFSAVMEHWQVVPFGESVIKEVIGICQKETQADFEDVLQCLCAKANGCDVLITNDREFYRCGIEVVGVGKYLKL